VYEYCPYRILADPLSYFQSSNPCVVFTPSKPPSIAKNQLLKKIQQIRRSGNHGFNSLELFKHRYNNFAAYTQIKIHFQSLPVDFFRRFAFSPGHENNPSNKYRWENPRNARNFHRLPT
jgi:hypothetical protein